MSDHRDWREALGSYVLGGLESEERHAVEGHLESCASCRDELARLSALPPLLDHLTGDEAAESSLLPSSRLATRVAAMTLQEQSRLSRQLRVWRAGTVAASTAALLAVLGWAPWDTPSADRWVLQPSSLVAPVDGTAAALAWEWGTTVELDLEDLPPADRYAMWAVAVDGRREQAGTWGRTASGRTYVRGASAIQRGDLARIEVVAVGGPVLATFEVGTAAG
jgi:anti-sigma factor RsiW